MCHATEGRRAAREALALAPHRHDELLQRDAVQALGQVHVPGQRTDLGLSSALSASADSKPLVTAKGLSR